MVQVKVQLYALRKCGDSIAVREDHFDDDDDDNDDDDDDARTETYARTNPRPLRAWSAQEEALPGLRGSGA